MSRRVKQVASAALHLGMVAVLVYLMRVTSEQILVTQKRERMPAGWALVRPPVDVGALAVRRDEVWTGGRDGLSVVDRRTLALRVQPDGGPSFGHVYAILRVGDTIWIAHDDGLTTHDGRGWRTVHADRCRSLARDREGRLWAGFDRAVGRLDGERWTWLPPPPSEADVLFVDTDGSVWVGCMSPAPQRGGLFHLEGDAWRPLEGLPHRSVNAVMRDRQGVLWVGTGFAREGAAARIQGGRLTVVGRQEGMAGEKVRSIHEDAEGRLWFGSEYDGVAIFGGKRRIVITEAEGLAGRELKIVVRDDEGVWWLGTDGGMNRVQDSAVPR